MIETSKDNDKIAEQVAIIRDANTTIFTDIAAVSTLYLPTLISCPHSICIPVLIFLFTIVNIISSRIVIYADRVEMIGLFTKRFLAKAEIDRIEIVRNIVWDNTIKHYLLVAKTTEAKAIAIPRSIALNETWMIWSSGIKVANGSRDAGIDIQIASMIIMAFSLAPLVIFFLLLQKIDLIYIFTSMS